MDVGLLPSVLNPMVMALVFEAWEKVPLPQAITLSEKVALPVSEK
jgi:hypothetical protein